MSNLIENILKEIDNRNYGLAIELCDKLISHQPNNENIYELKAGCFSALKDYKSAADCYGNAVDLAVINKIPANDISRLHSKKGKTHLKLAEVENAAREFRAALDYKPDSDKANNDYSACLRRLDLCEEALEFANKAIALNPHSAEYYNNRGNIYYCLGMADESVRDYDKAIELNPAYANAYFNRGSIYYESLNDKDKARLDWKKAIELNPEYRDELKLHSEEVSSLIDGIHEEPPSNDEKINIADKITVVSLGTDIEKNEPPAENEIKENIPEPETPVENKNPEVPKEDSSDLAKVTDLFPDFNIKPEQKDDNTPAFSDYSDIFSSDAGKENMNNSFDDFKIPEFDFKSIFQEASDIPEIIPEEPHADKDLNIEGIKELHDEIQKPAEEDAGLSGISPVVKPFEEIYTPQPATFTEPEPESKPWYAHPVMWVAVIAIVIFSALFAGYYYLMNLGNDKLETLVKADSTLKSITAPKDTSAVKTETAEKENDTTAKTEQKTETQNTGNTETKTDEMKKEETKTGEQKPLESKFLGYLSDKKNFALFSEPDGYYVQIGSFKDKTAAYDRLNFLKDKNIKGSVYEADLKEKGVLFRVRAGSFESQEKAKEVMLKLE